MSYLGNAGRIAVNEPLITRHVAMKPCSIRRRRCVLCVKIEDVFFLYLFLARFCVFRLFVLLFTLLCAGSTLS